MEHGLWKACAGTTSPLPELGDLVYYFPEGHAEHAYTTPPPPPPDCSSSSPAPVKPARASMLLCRIAYLHLSAHSISHEVYAKFIIIPSSSPAFADPGQLHPHPPEPPHPSQEQYINYARVLEPSDFGKDELSVPCGCAESIFPKLDYRLNPPTQIFYFRDVHGKPWVFKHVYQGNRHLLTTGWSKFAESNLLFHGDAVVFIRDPHRSLNDNQRFFIGIRRAICNRAKLSNRFPSSNEEESEGEEGCYTRRTLCRVSQKSVAEAERRAVAGQPFMATFYPNAGLSEFVVAKQTVDASLAVKWAPGLGVRMMMVDAETSSSRTGPTYYGTVSCTGSLQENGWSTCSGWAGWQSLEIEWDDREMMNKMKKVNPWEVELTVTTTPLYAIVKRMKLEEGTSHEEGLEFVYPIVSGMEAERRAVAEQPFMATLNPNAGWLEFVVDKASMSVKWAPGMRVRKMISSGSSFRPGPAYYGTVSSTGFLQENGRWSGWAWWQPLEIEWDDPEMMNNRKEVHAWEVEPIVTTTSPYSIKKKMKLEEETSHAGLHCSGISSSAMCEHESQNVPNSSDSDSPTSDIMSPAVGSQKTFKLFGKIIQKEGEIQ